MINNLHIQNYKSISQLDLRDCKRINVFVGEPNAGKSNILEALDLSYLSWMIGSNQSNELAGTQQIDIKQYFRISQTTDFFHYGDISKPVSIKSDFVNETRIEYINNREKDSSFFLLQGGSSAIEIDNHLNLLNGSVFGSPVKPYRYRSNIQFHNTGNYIDHLMPPFGNNLANVIRFNNDMQELCKNFASGYGFEFNINSATNDISLLLRLKEGLIYTLPFEALADTSKRILFHIAAIRHNNAFIITLDEPDTHAFPKYVSLLADEIIERSDRQFFITTHNPYLLNELIERTPDNQLSIFICGFNNTTKSTIAKKLSDNDLSELLTYGVDIFFNINRYLNDAPEYSA